jgi:hypothetical protein
VALAILNELGQNFHFLARQWPEKRIQKFKSRVADLSNNQGELLSKPWSQVHLPRLGKKEALNLQNFTAPHGFKSNSYNEIQ